MPNYHNIKEETVEGKRTLQKLLNLRNAIAVSGVPEKTQDRTILVATWNVRDLNKPMYGFRLEESMYYIAEILAHFDIIAIQEVYKDLKALNKVMSLLGPHWDYVFSDTTEGRRGNRERMAYIFNKRKVEFGGLAGQLVIPPLVVNKEVIPSNQVWRTPLICGFQSGWAKFMMCTVHIQWGSSEANSPQRVEEIRQIAQHLKKRTEDESAWARKLILLGDFNIFNTESLAFQELEKAGFQIPESLKGLKTNVNKDKTYDQIAFREREHSMIATGNAGAFDFFNIVFREDEMEIYEPYMQQLYERRPNKIWNNKSDAQKLRYYKAWRTHQISDHLPLWVELEVDFADDYLAKKLLKGEMDAFS